MCELKKNIDDAAYYQAYFINPQPKHRFSFSGKFGLTLYYQDFEAEVAFYQQVLSLASYQEGDSTCGWRIGAGWLTFLRGK